MDDRAQRLIQQIHAEFGASDRVIAALLRPPVARETINRIKQGKLACSDALADDLAALLQWMREIRWQAGRKHFYRRKTGARSTPATARPNMAHHPGSTPREPPTVPPPERRAAPHEKPTTQPVPPPRTTPQARKGNAAAFVPQDNQFASFGSLSGELSPFPASPTPPPMVPEDPPPGPSQWEPISMGELWAYNSNRLCLACRGKVETRSYRVHGYGPARLCEECARRVVE